jgi:hypothetical protein
VAYKDTAKMYGGVGIGNFNLTIDNQTHRVGFVGGGGVIQIDNNKYVTVDASGKIGVASLILDTNLGIVIPIADTNVKINDLTCSFDPLSPHILQIKYKGKTWFSLKLLKDIILGLFEEVPMPKLKIIEGENIEFPVVSGESFTVKCELDLEPIYNWIEESFKNCKSGFPDAKNLIKMGKWFVKMVAAINLPDEAWDIIANTFNAAMKFALLYTRPQYESVKWLMPFTTYNNITADIQGSIRDNINKAFIRIC